MPFFIFVRIEPQPGKERDLLDELRLVLEPTRAEPGCVRIHLFESVRPPAYFFIQSEWTDEAAFEAHARLPHTQRLIRAVEELGTEPLQAWRTRQVA